MLEKHQQIFEQIKKAENILICFPSLWNGDAVASALAMRAFLNKLGKRSSILSTKEDLSEKLSTPSVVFSFLPGFKDIKTNIDEMGSFIISLDTSKAKVHKLRYKNEDASLKFIITAKEGGFSSENVKTSGGLGDFDLIITIDSCDLSSLGSLFEKNTDFFYNTPTINIDHHSANEEYGQINLVKLTAVSSSEIIYGLINSYDEKMIDNDIATCLLTGIVIKTRNFKTPNITPETLALTSKLIIKEARRDEIVNKLFRSRNMTVLKLWGRILARLSGSTNNRIIWSTISESDFIKTGTTHTDLSDVIDELIINIPQAEVIMIFYENPINKDGSGRPLAGLLMHTPKDLNILDIVRSYDPKGTERSLMIESNRPLKEMKKELIELVDRKIGQIKFQ